MAKDTSPRQQRIERLIRTFASLPALRPQQWAPMENIHLRTARRDFDEARRQMSQAMPKRVMELYAENVAVLVGIRNVLMMEGDWRGAARAADGVTRALAGLDLRPEIDPAALRRKYAAIRGDHQAVVKAIEAP